MQIDLSGLKTTPKEMEVTVNDMGTGLFLTLQYESTPELQQLKKTYEKRLMDEGRKGRNGDTASVLEWYKGKKILMHVIGWRLAEGGLIKGSLPEFSREALANLISQDEEFGYFVREFIDVKTDNPANFLAKSA